MCHDSYIVKLANECVAVSLQLDYTTWSYVHVFKCLTFQY